MKNTTKEKGLTVKKKGKAKDLIFGGASSLMSKPTNDKEVVERKLIVLTAKALGINPFGVNILGSLPYTNNIGRKEKLEEYSSGARFEYRWVQRALDDTMKAICEARVVDAEGKALCDFVTGECSPKTIKMGPLQGYQNHMAQTRAENRAFEAAFGARFRQDLFKGIERELKAGKVSNEMADAALTAAKTSYEEASDIRQRASASSDVYDRALRAIATQTKVSDLEKAKANIERSALYNEDQRNQLIRLIDGRIAAIKTN